MLCSVEASYNDQFPTKEESFENFPLLGTNSKKSSKIVELGEQNKMMSNTQNFD